MNDFPDLDAAFQTAVLHDGERYRDARTFVLARPVEALPFLQSRRASPDWKTALVADILVGWIQHTELFEACTAAIQGKLPGPVPITGSFPPPRRINAVLALGQRVTPRLLEMAFKTKELGDIVQTESIFGALVKLKDPRVVMPLIDALESPRDEVVREWAASTLGPVGDRRAVPPLLSVLRNADNTETLRASAALSLGALDATAAIPDLEGIVRDQSKTVEFRKAAAMALADLKKPETAAVLLPLVDESDDLSFQLILLDTIGKIGEATTVPALQAIESGHPDEAVRDGAREAREHIEARLALH